MRSSNDRTRNEANEANERLLIDSFSNSSHAVAQTVFLHNHDEFSEFKNILIAQTLARGMERGAVVTGVAGFAIGFVTGGVVALFVGVPAMFLAKNLTQLPDKIIFGFVCILGMLTAVPGTLIGFIATLPRAIHLYSNRTFRYSEQLVALLCDGLRNLIVTNRCDALKKLKDEIIRSYGSARFATSESKELINTLNNYCVGVVAQARGIIRYLTERKEFSCFEEKPGRSLSTNQGKRLFNTIVDVCVSFFSTFENNAGIPDTKNPWRKRDVGIAMLMMEGAKGTAGRLPHDVAKLIGSFLFSNQQRAIASPYYGPEITSLYDSANQIRKSVGDILRLGKIYKKHASFFNMTTKEIFREGEGCETALARLRIEAEKHPGKASAKTLEEWSKSHGGVIPNEDSQRTQMIIAAEQSQRKPGGVISLLGRAISDALATKLREIGKGIEPSHSVHDYRGYEASHSNGGLGGP